MPEHISPCKAILSGVVDIVREATYHFRYQLYLVDEMGTIYLSKR